MSKSIKAKKLGKSHKLYAEVLHQLGCLCVKTKNCDSAKMYLNQASEIYVNSGNKNICEYYVLRVDYGNTLCLCGNLEGLHIIKDSMNKITDICGSNTLPLQANAWVQLADSYAKLSQIENADQAYIKSITLANKAFKLNECKHKRKFFYEKYRIFLESNGRSEEASEIADQRDALDLAS